MKEEKNCLKSWFESNHFGLLLNLHGCNFLKLNVN